MLLLRRLPHAEAVLRRARAAGTDLSADGTDAEILAAVNRGVEAAARDAFDGARDALASLEEAFEGSNGATPFRERQALWNDAFSSGGPFGGSSCHKFGTRALYSDYGKTESDGFTAALAARRG